MYAHPAGRPPRAAVRKKLWWGHRALAGDGAADAGDGVLERRDLCRSFAAAVEGLGSLRWGAALVLLELDAAPGGDSCRRSALRAVCRTLRDQLPFPATLARPGRSELVLLLHNVPEPVARMAAATCTALVQTAGAGAGTRLQVRAGVTMLELTDDLTAAMLRAHAEIFAQAMGGPGRLTAQPARA